MSEQKTYDFGETLPDLDGGVFVQKVSAAVKDAAMATVTNHKKKGKVTLTLTFSRLGDSNQIHVDHTLKMEKPTRRGKAVEEDSTSTVLHVGRGGALSIMPYNQGDMFRTKEETE